MSLMTGSIIADFSTLPSFVPGESEIRVASAIAFMIGFYHVFFSLSRLGFLSQFMSEQMTSGFITAAACYVFSSQLAYLTGLKTLKASGSGPFSLIQFYIKIGGKVVEEANMVTCSISFCSILVLGFYKLYLMNKFASSKSANIRRLTVLPSELILVLLITFLSWFLDLNGNYDVEIIGSVPKGLPNFVGLDYSLLLENRLWLTCLPVSVVAFALTYSTGVTFANKHGYEVVPNQELMAIGATNLICSQFNCIPTAAALSRSALMDSMGAKSQITAFVNSAIILVVLLFLSPLLSFLPKCVLASIICVALKSLFMKSADFKKYFALNKIDGVSSF